MKIPAAGPERKERMIELASGIMALNGSLEVRETGKPTRAVWHYADELAMIVLAEHGDRTPTKEDSVDPNAQRRYAVIRIEFPPDTGDHAASKQADHLVEAAGGYGNVFLVDEGIASATERED